MGHLICLSKIYLKEGIGSPGRVFKYKTNIVWTKIRKDVVLMEGELVFILEIPQK